MFISLHSPYLLWFLNIFPLLYFTGPFREACCFVVSLYYTTISVSFTQWYGTLPLFQDKQVWILMLLFWLPRSPLIGAKCTNRISWETWYITQTTFSGMCQICFRDIDMLDAEPANWAFRPDGQMGSPLKIYSGLKCLFQYIFLSHPYSPYSFTLTLVKP